MDIDQSVMTGKAQWDCSQVFISSNSSIIDEKTVCGLKWHDDFYKTAKYQPKVNVDQQD